MSVAKKPNNNCKTQFENCKKNNETYIIAEIGTSHGGIVEEGYKLIDAAANAGANCVKFQWVYASEILHPNTGLVSLPTGTIRLYDRFRKLEVLPSFFEKMLQPANVLNILFLLLPKGVGVRKKYC